MSFPDEREAVTKILQQCANPCIFDLGAHEGEDTEWMLAVCADKNPRAVVVEADHINFMNIFKRSIPGVHLYIHGAIAAYDGECEFYASRTKGGGYGSIYKPLPDLPVDHSTFEKVPKIPCFTFDSLYKNAQKSLRPMDHIDMLWVDIHGAEKDMITYGREALKHTRHLFIEYFDTPLYEGMATREELLAMLPGWTLLATFPWNLLLRNDNE